MIEEFRRHVPAMHADLARLAAGIGQARYNQLVAEVWPGIQKISVDYALMEHIQEEVYVIPVEMGWQDIGDFGTLYTILSGDDGANVVHADVEPILVDTNKSLVISKRLVATVGVEDLIIVDTDDVLLICRHDRAQDVKQVVETIRKGKRDNYL